MVHSDLCLTNYRTDQEESLKLNLKFLDPLCTIKRFTRAAGQVTVNSESGGDGSLKYLSKTSGNRGWVKAKLFLGGGGTEGVTTPAPPKNFDCVHCFLVAF